MPLTPGRDLGVQTLWNAWAQLNTLNVSDRRYGLDLRSRSGTISFGLDRKLNDDVVLGLTGSLQNSTSLGFDDNMRVESKGFSIGPYVAIRITPQWAMDATFTYGETRNEVQLAILNGSYTPQIYSGSFSLHGQYTLAGFFVRPKGSLYYTHVRNPTYDMVGSIFGFPLNVGFPSNRFNVGVVEASNDVYVMPYVEFGARYEFDRPNGGEMLAGDFSPVVPTAWSGFVRPGLRTSIANSWLIEVAGGYLSIGRNGLDIWEGKFRVSYGF